MSASNDNTRTLLTITEVCARWGVARKTVLEMIQRGELTAVRLGLRTFRVPVAEVEERERARLSG